MKGTRVAALTAVLLGGLLTVCQASTVLHLSNEELAKRAQVILHGKCTYSAARAAEDPIVVTEYTFDVYEFLKGGTPGAKTFTFTALGGTFEGRGYAISGSATYAPGEEVVVFLDAPHPKTGCRHAIGLSQGKYSVREEPDTKTKYLVRDLGGLRLVDGKGKAIEAPVDGPRLYLEPFLVDVRAMVAGKR